MELSTFKNGLVFLALLMCLFLLGGEMLTTIGLILVVTGLLAFIITLVSQGHWSQADTLDDLAFRRLFSGPIGLLGCLIDVKEWRFARKLG